MFTLKFSTDNAAFEDAPELEMARILREVAKKVTEGYNSGPILDANGNKIGEWSC